MGDDGAGDTVPEGQGNGGRLTISIPGLPTFPMSTYTTAGAANPPSKLTKTKRTVGSQS